MEISVETNLISPKKDVLLAPYTVFNAGGGARFFYEATSSEDLKNAVRWAHQYALPLFLLGAGSNTLISDAGFHGLVIRPKYSAALFLGNTVQADAGMMMPKLSSLALKENFSGLEWALGIPGTIGGSIRGNAGCFGKSIGELVELVTVFDTAMLREKKLSHHDCCFRYRDSIFKRHPEYIILSVSLHLHPGERHVIQKTMRDFSEKRVATQAIGEKCAGCVFKNIPWGSFSFQKRRRILSAIPDAALFANQEFLPSALVLDRLGLKGKLIGRAKVSEKHANFFINERGASSHELTMLISHCKEYVHRKTGILLEEEIQYI